ncbi:MAG TPA: DMT family transporter [Methylomirabilota bacterium]|nr:DMT family transporter [Methylomirabilota bacterium]
MTAGALALVVVAAVLHAAWNALAKRGTDPVVFLWWTSAGATVLLAPLGLRELLVGGFPAAALPFVVATVALHALYFYALGRAYATGAFSLVYPIARGLGVALVPVAARLLFDERVSLVGALGIALVVAGIAVLHRQPRLPVTAARAGAARRGTAWAVVTGLTIAGYALVDKAGVARLHPVPYMMLMEAGSVLVLLPLVAARPAAVRREWVANARTIVAAAVMSAAAYTLVLFAFRLSKTGYVVAARELSILLSALIGSLWLGEGRLAPRLAGGAVILAGVACVAAGR